MRLVKENKCEYWVNDKNQLHGEYKLWWPNGQLKEQCFWVNDTPHGEGKGWNRDGSVSFHYIWANGKLVSSQTGKIIPDEERFLLALTWGVKLIESC